ncbi:hypothetical protein Baya_14261 [Bagarius yarrelli]|uniref:Uncharacterized protein n=1 Tax=Bagarius yarrelli TaxID=175774 RepID=A0A556V8I5_BAGYA|nr:hypothetical protein Baya_14261 [Bagarius yarrelli]
MSTAALESQATIHKEVIEKREEVKRSNKHVAELKINLQNPAGNSIQQAQIHNRKCEAIMKRLRCQLNKAQSSYEELKSAIFHMEKQVDNLKKQPGTSYIVD